MFLFSIFWFPKRTTFIDADSYNSKIQSKWKKNSKSRALTRHKQQNYKKNCLFYHKIDFITLSTSFHLRQINILFFFLYFVLNISTTSELIQWIKLKQKKRAKSNQQKKIIIFNLRKICFLRLFLDNWRNKLKCRLSSDQNKWRSFH